mmetsp:Transcript_36022/g.94675  ORF Transcript_36022/g.94675 Transcript_36022/m.94675 type:complete len:122 (-) Transcript_36022:242-607(-)
MSYTGGTEMFGTGHPIKTSTVIGWYIPHSCPCPATTLRLPREMNGMLLLRAGLLKCWSPRHHQDLLRPVSRQQVWYAFQNLQEPTTHAMRTTLIAGAGSHSLQRKELRASMQAPFAGQWVL